MIGAYLVSASLAREYNVACGRLCRSYAASGILRQ